jgi:hypothetical protein
VPFANPVCRAAQQPPQLPRDQQPDIHESRRTIGQIDPEIPRRDGRRQHQHDIPLRLILRFGIVMVPVSGSTVATLLTMASRTRVVAVALSVVDSSATQATNRRMLT